MILETSFGRAAAVLPLLLALPARAGDILIDLPQGGWRASQGERVEYSQPVNYPAVLVSLPPGQARAGSIVGRIAGAAKPGRAPATLIVNGVAMPQRVDEDGGFARPYAFGAGSNSVSLRDPDAGERRVQFYEAYAQRGISRLKIVLSWDSDGTDLDLHVITPDGGHVFYGNRVLENGAALDVDVTTGYGPEIVAIPAPPEGAYLVYVNYYGAGEGQTELTTARIHVISQENTPAEKLRTFTVPLRNAGELLHVASFVYP
jgi:uncharacterized protein YfaP (DUF2135 family)